LTPNFGISWKIFRRFLLAGLAIFLGFKLVEFVQEGLAWREASRLAVLAAEDLANNQRELARGNLSLALSMSPDHVEASRLAARLADLEGDSRALGYHETVLGSWSAAALDWTRGALSAARFKESDLALKWAAKASKLNDDPAFPHIVRAEVHASRGETFEQERELRLALSQRESTETLNALAFFLLNRNEDISLHAAEAASFLWRIGQIDPGPAGLDALRLALSSGILDQENLTEWLDAYRVHPSSDPAASLFVDEIQLGLFPESRASVFEGVVSRGLALQPLERVSLARWLLQNQQNSAVPYLLPLNEAIKNSQTFQCWIDATIGLKKWDQINDALKDPANPLPSYQTQALYATMAGIKGDSAVSEKLWREVMQNNRVRPEIFLELLIQLVRAGEWKTFYLELPVLLNDPAWALKTVETLIPVVRKYQDSSLMLDFYQQTMKSRFLIKESLPKDRAAYTRLILGETVPMEDLEMRAKKYPENASFRITYALGLLKSGSKVKSLFVVQDIEPAIQPGGLLPHQRAVYAAILAANGLHEEAQDVIKTIPPASLTRQEEALQAVLSGAKMGN
jgi:hypothetical protein